MRRTLATLLLLGILSPASRAGDLADWPFPDLGDLYPDHRAVTLDDLVAHPEAYRDLHISFPCRFDRSESTAMPFFTRFRGEEFYAISVYGPDAPLWTEAGYSSSYPIVFAPRESEDLVTRLMSLRRFQKFVLYGQVQDLFSGRPWIEIQGIAPVREPVPAEQDLVLLRTALRESGRGHAEVAADLLGTLLARPLPEYIRNLAERERGGVLLASGRPAEAVRHLRAVCDRDRRDAGVRRMLGEAYARQAAWPASAEAYRDSLAVEPRDAGGWIGLARAEKAQGRWEEARVAAAEALAADPACAAAWRIRGEVSVSQDRWQEAAASFEEAISLEPPGAPSDFREMGKARATLGDIAGAVDAFERARALEPRHLDGLDLCAHALLRAGAASDAEARWEEARGIDAGYVPALRGLTRLRTGQRRWEDAAAPAAQWAQAAPGDPEALAAHGTVSLRLGNAAGAVPALRACVAADPARVDAWIELAAAYESLVRIPEAIDSLVQAQREEPGRVALWTESGRLRLASGQTREASADLSEAERRCAPEPLPGPAAVDLASALAAQGRFDDAFARFEALLPQRPQDVQLLNNYAYHLLRADRNPALALSLAGRAREQAPERFEVRHTYGWALLKTDQPQAALDPLRGVFEEFPMEWVVGAHLAEALLRSGDAAGAEALAADLERRGGEAAREARRLRDQIRRAAAPR